VSTVLATIFDDLQKVQGRLTAYKYLHAGAHLGPGSLEREAPSGSAENLQRIFEMSYQRS
jgi:hypothetical protein